MSEVTYLRPFKVCDVLRRIKTHANRDDVNIIESYLLRLEHNCMAMHNKLSQVRFAVRELPLVPDTPFRVFRHPPLPPVRPGPKDRHPKPRLGRRPTI